MSRAEPTVPTREERERRIVEIARFRARLIGARIRHFERWDADYSLRRAARNDRKGRAS